MPGPSSSTASADPRTITRTAVPGGVCSSALSTSARPIRNTRSRSASAAPPCSTRTLQRMLPLQRDGGELSRSAPAMSTSSTRSRAGRTWPASIRDRSSRSVASRAQPRDLLRRRDEELSPRLLVELLVLQQLQEPAQREDRGTQLVRGVRDERAPGVVEAGELEAHPVERAGELAELVCGRGRRRAPRSPPTRSARPRARAAGSRRVNAEAAMNPTRIATAERAEPGPEPAVAHDPDGGADVTQRRREQQHVAARIGHGDLGERLAAALDAATHDDAARRRLARERIAGEIAGREDVLRVVLRQQRARSAAGQHLEVDDARVRGPRRVVDEVLVDADACAHRGAAPPLRTASCASLPSSSRRSSVGTRATHTTPSAPATTSASAMLEPGPNAPERVHEPAAQSLRAA